MAWSFKTVLLYCWEVITQWCSTVHLQRIKLLLTGSDIYNVKMVKCRSKLDTTAISASITLARIFCGNFSLILHSFNTYRNLRDEISRTVRLTFHELVHEIHVLLLTLKPRKEKARGIFKQFIFCHRLFPRNHFSRKYMLRCNTIWSTNCRQLSYMEPYNQRLPKLISVQWFYFTHTYWWSLD